MARLTKKVYSTYIKRVLDAFLASLLLVLLSPLMLVVAVTIRVFLGSPVFFRQRRPGRGGVPFEVLKFRTMRPATDDDTRGCTDAERMTRLGRFLRSSSLDELPELLNIVRGEMSLVGPRPLLLSYLDRYTTEQARRHDARPGLTGWAQIHGRNRLSWEERFKLDVWYVEHVSFLLDLRIMMRTVGLVVRGDGVAADGHVTMPEFKGSEARPPGDRRR